MFIGWIRKKSFYIDLEDLSSKIIIDKSLITKTFELNNSLCFGVYDKNTLVVFISANELEKTILINNFYYVDGIGDDIKTRVIKLLLNNLNNTTKTVLFMATDAERQLFLELKFTKHCKFEKVVYRGGAVFNFSNDTAKSINNENYMPIITNINEEAFSENRVEYIKKTLFKQSSLILSSKFGYQHSYAINKSLIKISPWIMNNGAFIDAEKMIRGIIYYRGLKEIFAFIPSDIKEITNLYKSYKFISTTKYSLLYLNSAPLINLDMIYAF